MATKKKKGNRQIIATARQVLEFAEQRAEQGADWIEMHNALFGIGGKATVLFTNESERTAFCRTDEYKRILALMDRLPAPVVAGADFRFSPCCLHVQQDKPNPPQ